ncbi:hypothetical protein J8273_7799 [Carpediemonas membranifera]|uniref:Uncharacterized protein n=1 Tax=Carpediemonas membranifera TaxID=201153 RepID=A0A8J6AQ32_9EUKA|nr:hypothetical protein J8273_7799 [Carpediemonas membranifera]|eukprot:KAG9390448.1 hypothetical protein J8273_7799 [Carpediemonas membranifera]
MLTQLASEYTQLAKLDKKLQKSISAALALFPEEYTDLDYAGIIREHQGVLLQPCLNAMAKQTPKAMFTGMLLVSRLLGSLNLTEPHLGDIAMRVFELSREKELHSDDKIRLMLIKLSQFLCNAAPTLDESGVTLSTAISALVNLKISQDSLMPVGTSSIVTDAVNGLFSVLDGLLSVDDQRAAGFLAHTADLFTDMTSMAAGSPLMWLNCRSLTPQDALGTVTATVNQWGAIILGHEGFTKARAALSALCGALIDRTNAASNPLLDIFANFPLLVKWHHQAATRGWSTCGEAAFVMEPLIGLLYSTSPQIHTIVLSALLKGIGQHPGADSTTTILSHCLSLVSVESPRVDLTYKLATFVINSSQTTLTLDQIALSASVIAQLAPGVELAEALSCVERLWALSDRSAEVAADPDADHSAVQSVLTQIICRLADVALDSRIHVRTSAVKTLFGVVSTHGDILEEAASARAVQEIMRVADDLLDRLAVAVADQSGTPDFVDVTQSSPLASVASTLSVLLAELTSAVIQRGVVLAAEDRSRVIRMAALMFQENSAQLRDKADRAFSLSVVESIVRFIAFYRDWSLWVVFAESIDFKTMTRKTAVAWVAQVFQCTPADFSAVLDVIRILTRTPSPNAEAAVQTAVPLLSSAAFERYYDSLAAHERVNADKVRPVHFMTTPGLEEAALYMMDVLPADENCTYSRLAPLLADLVDSCDPRLYIAIQEKICISGLGGLPEPMLRVLATAVERAAEHPLLDSLISFLDGVIQLENLIGSNLGLDIASADLVRVEQAVDFIRRLSPTTAPGQRSASFAEQMAQVVRGAEELALVPVCGVLSTLR